MDTRRRSYESAEDYARRLCAINREITISDPTEAALDKRFWDLQIEAAQMLDKAEAALFSRGYKRRAEVLLSQADLVAEELDAFPKADT